jgi:hypothetical protein
MHRSFSPSRFVLLRRSHSSSSWPSRQGTREIRRNELWKTKHLSPSSLFLPRPNRDRARPSIRPSPSPKYLGAPMATPTLSLHLALSMWTVRELLQRRARSDIGVSDPNVCFRRSCRSASDLDVCFRWWWRRSCRLPESAGCLRPRGRRKLSSTHTNIGSSFFRKATPTGSTELAPSSTSSWMIGFAYVEFMGFLFGWASAK